ncbi:MAG: L-seryl-tRNA(Sec) selenium transferase [Pseudonocardia sp.]|uniref:L-seryl-tRNA(Sec) selenium transferase n=1 Tax=unclassified Pseudonocardia TaxID=2619320 RepID=UPI0008690C0D|nr:MULTISPECIES: L-seryl-tRNA(Sec) selenium transferase [unclassified Pseudonocardia]MBN9109207.1 L-seryl-tRNA(Sec) selenium transferase [Pseudonocardia sp.]ODU12188.1 MAG: L-seryl-tRNA(Sec) selenium transferase [Pseudonocardia sp. SCN 72-51]ODV01497.1 MAG: L-seryl-tRNA(Sec) selenium transferase [Pseudonocardia sp. SCN 73-27]
MSADHRRLVPRTDAVLAEPRVAAAVARLGRELVKRSVVDAQARARAGEIPPADVTDAALAALPSAATSLRPVLNATGVLLHTNMGRAPLSAAAVEALAVAAGTCDVELDLATGGRGRRGAATIDALLAAVPGAAAAHLVNNGAAVLALVATGLAAGREIVVARGELVEIGDGFRIPDLLVSTGARLREVGTTNRVHPRDYAEAIGPDTAFVLKVHPSNFTISGFTKSVGVAELAELAGDVPVVADIGSGLLTPHPLLPDEPDAASALAEGAALVTASGDKLLGGPQAGLLLGGPGRGAELVERLRRHPLARALRVDKLTLAAAEATLTGPTTPTRAALDAVPAALRVRAARLAAAMRDAGVEAADVASVATVGGGGAPGVTLESAAVSLPERFAVALRAGDPAVVGRLEHGRCLLDLRALPPSADATLAAAVLAVRG